MEWAPILQGIIISGFFGLAIGNFATNPIYRLPRNESLFKKDPYCGDCNSLLTPKDLFPVLSWLMTRGKCRYCGAPVPGAYTLVEAFLGVMFVVAYLKFGFSEYFLLTAFGTTCWVMIAAMLYIDNFFSNRTLVVAMATGAIYRTLLDETIYGFAGGAFFGLLVGATIWRLSGQKMERDMSSFPGYLKMLVAAGMWLELHELLMVMPVVAVAHLLGSKIKWAVEYALTTAVLLLTFTHM